MCSVSKLLLLILQHLNFWTSSHYHPAAPDSNVNNNLSLVHPGHFKVLIIIKKIEKQHVRCSISEWTFFCLLLAADFLLTAFVFWQVVCHICVHAVIPHVTTVCWSVSISWINRSYISAHKKPKNVDLCYFAWIMFSSFVLKRSRFEGGWNPECRLEPTLKILVY